MDMILLTIIGSEINASKLYWVCFWIYVAIRTVKAIVETCKERGW